MTALTDAMLVTGIALTALLFAFGVRRLPGLQSLLPRTHPRRYNRAPRRYDIPRSRRGIHPARLHARPPLSRPRGAQRPGPDRALLADRPNSRGSRPSPPTCGADAGTSSAPRMVAPAWPTPFGWQSKEAASPSSSSVRCSPPAATCCPTSSSPALLLVPVAAPPSPEAGWRAPTRAEWRASAILGIALPAAGTGGRSGRNRRNRLDGRAAASHRSRVHAAFRACAYVSRAGGRSWWLRAGLCARGCRRGVVRRAAGTGRPCAGPGPPRRVRASRRR